MFAWFPRSPKTTMVSVYIEGPHCMKCLERLPYVFPNMTEFTLEGQIGYDRFWGGDMEFLRPLSRCLSLTRLELECQQMAPSAAGLAMLLGSLPVLESATFLRYWGVDKPAISAQLLAAHGRTVSLEWANK